MTIDNDFKLVAKAEEVLQEMKDTEGYATRNDLYTPGIPRTRLADWYETLHNVLFRLRAEIEV